jgi:hypothetical protein
MPRFQYGTHQLYFLPDFADGAIAALAEQQQYGPRAPGIVSDFNFSRLTGKGITSLMANAKLWVPSSAKRSVNAYRKLNHAAQREVLFDQGIYQYKGLAEVARTDEAEAEADCMAEAEMESEADWGNEPGASGSEDGGGSGEELLPTWN